MARVLICDPVAQDCIDAIKGGGHEVVEKTGMTPDELLEVTGDTILNKLGGLPKDDEHCAYLAGETLQEALNAYMMK